MNSGNSSNDLYDEVIALKRSRIIAVAVDLFYENGYEKTTLDAICHELGVTKPFIYSYFNSKLELLGEICSHGIRYAIKAMNTTITKDLSATAKLTTFAHIFVAGILKKQKHIAIFSREEKNLNASDLQRINKMRRDFDHKLIRLLKEGVRAKEFDVEDPRIAALAIGGLVSWTFVWYRPDGRLTEEQLSHTMVNLILKMVGAQSNNTGELDYESVQKSV